MDEQIIELLIHLIPRCDTCYIDLKKVPLIRVAKHQRKYKKKVLLCNKHGLRYKKGKYCRYCLRVLKKKDTYRKKFITKCSRCNEPTFFNS